MGRVIGQYDGLGFRLMAAPIGDYSAPRSSDRTARQASLLPRIQLPGLASESTSATDQCSQDQLAPELPEQPQAATSPAPEHLLALQVSQCGRS